MTYVNKIETKIMKKINSKNVKIDDEHDIAWIIADVIDNNFRKINVTYGMFDKNNKRYIIPRFFFYDIKKDFELLEIYKNDKATELDSFANKMLTLYKRKILKIYST